MHKKLHSIRFAKAVFLGSVAMGATQTAAQAGMNTMSLQDEAVLTGQSNIWGMAFVDEDTMLFTEKCLGLSVQMPDGSVNELLGMGASGEDVSSYSAVADDLFCDYSRQLRAGIRTVQEVKRCPFPAETFSRSPRPLGLVLRAPSDSPRRGRRPPSMIGAPSAISSPCLPIAST
ncbi:hypothetical protein [Histidinibacterium aquaticum]|uniref:Uncharacterized protein n=1 Tax=Histidinibacterium aquaticum TaxID=2613962 RepID=A0A5J5GKV0_9RHOB|nr:hypothetical protein [Histidinibacterium aquaticum]KAA9008760.1 hypothetical protein F3S47_05700 [Histidinibacterium aquaticum]